MAIDLLKEAREIVRTNPLTPKTVAIRNAADDLNNAWDLIKISLTRAALTNFVAHSTRLLLAIERFHAGGTPGPKSGTGEIQHDSGDEQPLAKAAGAE